MIDFGDLDLRLVWQTLSGPAVVAWKAWQPSVVVYRELADAAAYTEFEWLVEALDGYDPAASLTRLERLARWATSLV